MHDDVNELKGRTNMKAILRPYAIFPTMGDSERNVKTRLRTACGRGATIAQNVTISDARSMNVNE